MPVRWEPDEQGVARLIAKSRLERVAPSATQARHLIEEARRHLASAQVLAGTDDVSAAFVMAYDAARKALTAILAVQGLRAKGSIGGHAVLLDAVRALVGEPASRASGPTSGDGVPNQAIVLARFDWLRNLRNSTQYPDFERPTATPQDVAAAIPSATAIVDLADDFLAQP